MRVLLVEDSPVLQEALVRGFSRKGIALDVVGDGQEGLTLASNNPFDVLVLDLMLPGMDGMSVLRALRKSGSDLHVLILTARDGIEERIAGLQAGADDYLTKPFEFEELVARVQALARRKYREKSTSLGFGPLSIDTIRQEASVAGESISLTPREYAVLEHLAFRSGRPVTRIEIEDSIYSTGDLPTSNAVDRLICGLRGKLDAYGVKDWIRTKRGIGYVLEEPA